jgi:hypothetical protein
MTIDPNKLRQRLRQKFTKPKDRAKLESALKRAATRFKDKVEREKKPQAVRSNQQELEPSKPRKFSL